MGKDYTDIDDFPIYQPEFETKYSYARLRRNATNWEYRNNILDMGPAKRKDYFGVIPYNIYTYDGYPLRVAINTKAKNDKKLLITRCSFKAIPEYFLTTQFKEVYDIDVRYDPGVIFAQYHEEIKPDIVLMYVNISSSNIYNFGVEEYLSALAEPLGSIQDFGNMEIRAEGKNNNKFEVVCGNLESNKTYTLTLDSTKLSGVKDSFIQMTLQNMSKNKAVCDRYLKLTAI